MTGRLEGALRDFLERKGMDLKPGSKSFVSDCLACGKEGHLYIRRRSGQAICFKCGERWDWRGLVCRLEGCRRDDAWGILFGSGSEGKDEAEEGLLDEGKDPFGESESEPDTPINFLGPDFVPVERSEAGLAYLASRGVDDAQSIVDFDVRWHGSMRAVVFPVRRGGTLYGWQARRADPKEGELRLISLASMRKSLHLLNYDFATRRDALFVSEGPFDAIKAYMAGFGAVATLGKSVSQEQVRMMANSPCRSIYNGLDPDAFEEVYDLNARIGLGKRLLRPSVPEGRKDWGECSAAEVREACERATLVECPADLLEVHLVDPKGQGGIQ